MGLFKKRDQQPSHAGACYNVKQEDYNYNPNYFWSQCRNGVKSVGRSGIKRVRMCCEGGMGDTTVTESGSWGMSVKEQQKYQKQMEKEYKDFQTKQSKLKVKLFAPSH